MALDPQIALGFRPPQVDVQIPQPLQQLGQILSLQNLMRQGQLGDISLQQQTLQLEQARQAAQERQALAGYFQRLATPAPAADGGSAQPGGLTDGINYGEIMRIAPNLGPGFVKSHADAAKAYLDSQDAQYKVMQAQNARRSSLATGIYDEPSKTAAIATALGEGLITPAQRDRLMTMPWDAPEWKSWQQQALTADQALTQHREDIKQAWAATDQKHKEAMYPPQEQEATQKSLQAQLTTTGQQRTQDANVLAAAAAQGPDALNAAIAKLTPDRAALFAGAKTPLEVMQRALNPDQYVTQSHQNLQTLLEAAKYRLDKGKYDAEFGPDTAESWAATLYQNPDVKVPDNLRTSVMKVFRDKYGLPMPSPLEGQTKNQEMSSKATLDNIAWIRNAIQNPEVAKNIGPIMGNLGNVEQAAGSAIGLSPEATQLAQELRTRMRFLMANEAGSIRARINKQTMDALSQSSPRVNMDADMLKGALSGVEGNTLTTLDNLDRQRFGGQMRPRDVRGIGGSPVPANVTKALQGASQGIHQLSDGSVWNVNPDGSITPATAPKQ